MFHIALKVILIKLRVFIYAFRSKDIFDIRVYKLYTKAYYNTNLE